MKKSQGLRRIVALNLVMIMLLAVFPFDALASISGISFPFDIFGNRLLGGYESFTVEDDGVFTFRVDMSNADNFFRVYSATPTAIAPTVTHGSNYTDLTFELEAGQFTLEWGNISAVASSARLQLLGVGAQPQNFRITVSTQGRGTAAASRSEAQAGERVDLTATPEASSGYVFSRWEVISGGITIVNANSPNTHFIMPTNDVSVRAVFVNESAPVLPQQGGVTFSYVEFPPEQWGNVNQNQNVSFRIHVSPTQAARDAAFATMRFEWLRNGTVWGGSGGSGTISAATIAAPGFANIQLNIPSGTQAHRGGVWSLRITLLDAAGNPLFIDTGRTSLLEIRTHWHYHHYEDWRPAPAPTPRPTPAPTIPANAGSVNVAYQLVNNQATLTLPTSVVNNIVNTADNVVTFNLSNVENLTTTVIPRAAWRRFSNAGLGIEIEMPDGTVYFNAAAVRSVNGQAGTQGIAATLTEGFPLTGLSWHQSSAVAQGDTVFTVTTYSGAQRITGFANGTLAITVPYDGITPVRALRLDAAGNSERLPATFDLASSTVTFTTSRLSVFVVGPDVYVMPLMQPATTLPAMRFAMGNPFYTLNGVTMFSDVAPFVDAAYNRTMVPVRILSEGLNATVRWEGSTQTVYINNNGFEFGITVGESLPNNMGTAVNIDGRVFVPLRFASEMLGASYVRWDGVNRVAYIYN